VAKRKNEGPFAALEAMRDRLAREEEAAKTSAQAKKPAPAAAPRPRTNASAPTTNSTSLDDELAFHRLVSGVTPLDRSRAERLPRTVDATPSRSREGAKAAAKAAAEAAEEVHEHLRALVEGGTRFEVSDDGRRVEGRRTDVPPDWVRRLRRGLLPIDASLDLHGLRADEAREALGAFLAAKRARGERCVLVVHGRGEHAPRGVGVLRGEIAAWLSQGPPSAHVAAFATAREADGGEGAVYVLLRRG
jgi:DNA-nicking Smr family endonuclease